MAPQPEDRLTHRELLALQLSDTPLARARAAFSHAYASIEQAGMQRRPPSVFDIRRLEFAAVRQIATALGCPEAADLPEQFLGMSDDASAGPQAKRGP